MLTKVLGIGGLGLLHDVKCGARASFTKVTLIYGENGRGKSTFTTLLRSCANRDSDLLEDRVTIDDEVNPSARLMFGSAESSYQDSKWSGYTPETLIYDGNFVNENVYSGSEITSSQRANLLDFALGASAVNARVAEQKAKRAEETATEAVRTIRRQLEYLVSGVMEVPQFRALSEDPDIDSKIAEAERHKAAVMRISGIKKQPIPQALDLPALPLENFFRVLGENLESVHAKAAAQVSEHLSHLNGTDPARWVQEGLTLSPAGSCPFCGQDTDELELVQMYRFYFDHAYAELRRAVDETSTEVLAITQEETIQRLSSARARNNEIIRQWTEFVPLEPLQGDRDELASVSIENLRDMLESLTARKSSAITEACGSDTELEEASRLWDRIKSVFEDEKAIILGYNRTISDYVDSLETTTVERSEDELQRLRLVKLRHTDEVKKLISDANDADEKLKNAEKAKKDARETLSTVMRNTLTTFRSSINRHLDQFNAEFRIDEFSHNYRGKTPRIEYQIKLRGKSIELSGGRPTFATALSQGDKSTMAFAFFAASTLADPRLSEKIVVIDDPMSSLDSVRREHTVEVLVEIAKSAGQLILLAHDEHFLRGMRDKIARTDNPPQMTELELRAVESRYSDFQIANLDELCQSRYLSDYKKVSGVVNGTINDREGVALAALCLRSLLEGYLHRKYPGEIPSGITLGKAIDCIKKAEGTDSPCSQMAHRVDDLQHMNAYASKFHHNTQPDMEAARRESQVAIIRNGEKILDFIHSA